MFYQLHSRLIMQVQFIENDLRLIYAAISPGDFDEHVDFLDRANLGQILRELKRVDEEDGVPDLEKEDYDRLHRLREGRNYWCHQCFLDFAYISDDCMREEQFNRIADRLAREEEEARGLHQRMEHLRNCKLKEYHRV